MLEAGVHRGRGSGCPGRELTRVSLYLSNITIHDMGTAFAASILIMAPSVFLFACGQNYLEQGILASGLKE